MTAAAVTAENGRCIHRSSNGLRTIFFVSNFWAHGITASKWQTIIFIGHLLGKRESYVSFLLCAAVEVQTKRNKFMSIDHMDGNKSNQYYSTRKWTLTHFHSRLLVYCVLAQRMAHHSDGIFYACTKWSKCDCRIGNIDEGAMLWISCTFMRAVHFVQITNPLQCQKLNYAHANCIHSSANLVWSNWICHRSNQRTYIELDVNEINAASNSARQWITN